jgi:hypothetical protein
MSEPAAVDRKLAKRLVLDELFDLSLYQSLREVASGELRSILDRLIPIEARHLAFWRDFFDLHVERLDLARRVKLRLIVLLCRLFGAPAIHLVMEAIEVYGVRKYLNVWTMYRNTPWERRFDILEDEFEHEDAVVMATPSDGSIPRPEHLSRAERRPGRILAPSAAFAASAIQPQWRRASRWPWRGRCPWRLARGSRPARRGGPGDRDGPAAVLASVPSDETGTPDGLGAGGQELLRRRWSRLSGRGREYGSAPAGRGSMIVSSR